MKLKTFLKVVEKVDICILDTYGCGLAEDYIGYKYRGEFPTALENGTIKKITTFNDTIYIYLERY